MTFIAFFFSLYTFGVCMCADCILLKNCSCEKIRGRMVNMMIFMIPYLLLVQSVNIFILCASIMHFYLLFHLGN